MVPICRSNHSGNNGSSGSLPSSGGGGNGANGVSSMNSDDGNNGEYFNNNHGAGGDNSLGSEVCDVPYEVANQKRHVSIIETHPMLVDLCPQYWQIVFYHNAHSIELLYILAKDTLTPFSIHPPYIPYTFRS